MPRRKRRTRAHVIADLSANHVERHVLLAGYTVEHIHKDYGYGMTMSTYDPNGQIENGQVLIQLKATDHLRTTARGRAAACRVDVADLATWRHEWVPVILILYDASIDRAHWLCVQKHFGAAGWTASMDQRGALRCPSR